MKCYSYVVTRDFGFAPNPFYGYCTLATCKPRIRKKAEIGDWIFGISPKIKNNGNHLVYAMRVSRKITYNEYWECEEFKPKKPVMNGSLKQMYGDNIYFKNQNDGSWVQANSHHSFQDGLINKKNLSRDTKGQYVLIAEEFYYFGGDTVEIPFCLKNEFSIGIGHKIVKEKSAIKVIEWLKENYELGYHSDPKLFKNFERYKG
ncbi:MAG TPA: hypothetical protein PKA78_02400 [Macellibacteroides fermentans]|uniref:Nmad2 family putative nucleotide modification protein n=1 Tax=Macellibacteroides fermentans TaxID=879969 RepID=UPI002CD83180|nr:hypothetical protein [Macellibacteroides fermentans]